MGTRWLQSALELVDLYDHYDVDGDFWQPPGKSLAILTVPKPAKV